MATTTVCRLCHKTRYLYRAGCCPECYRREQNAGRLAAGSDEPEALPPLVSPAMIGIRDCHDAALTARAAYNHDDADHAASAGLAARWCRYAARGRAILAVARAA